jgi:amino acid adenylation domain-containing protein
MTRHWLGLLQHVVSAPDTALAELPVPDGEERARILTHGKGRTVAYPVRTVVDLVAEQVSRAPDAVAVTYGERSLTYAELWRDAGRTAHRLRARGVGPGSLVALRAQRSERLVVGLLGVLRAGAAYLPLDPHYPQGRLEFVRADSGAADELTDTELAPEATAAGDLRDAVGPEGTALDNAPPSTDTSRDGGAASAPAPGDLAYVIYTSGSTGRPKGVQVEHRSLANLLLSMRDLLDSGPGHTWLALTSVSFDIAHLEVFLPLVTGGTLVVAADEHVRDGKALGELVARHAVTHVQATPTSWAMLLDAGFHAPSVVALTGGEALPLPLAQRLRPEVARLLNVYGPTETTIWSACDDIAVDTERVTIGRPLAGELLHVLDRRLSSTLAGIPGDLYIAGSGLVRGYLGRPDLDAERFVANPFGPAGSRMYRTGDRAVHRPDGRLEFLGRTDEQIKLRGYRIELGEIEARMLAVSGVVQAAAVVREGRLIGYFAGRPGEGTVRRELAGELPAYMVPDLLVALDALPVTPNGKLDRKALQAPPDPAALEAEAADAPLEAVRGIWCEVLGVPQVDDSENLFDLGGHSITMTQISARIWDRLGADVPLHAYFDDPTVRGIAAVVAEQLRTQC